MVHECMYNVSGDLSTRQVKAISNEGSLHLCKNNSSIWFRLLLYIFIKTQIMAPHQNCEAEGQQLVFSWTGNRNFQVIKSAVKCHSLQVVM